MSLYNYFYRQCRNNKISSSLVPESKPIDLDRRYCSYVKNIYTSYKKEKQIIPLQLPSSNIYNDVIQDIIDNREPSGTMSIEFIDNKFDRNNNLYDVKHGLLVDNLSLKFEGPTLCSECKITKLDVADYDREFGYIQTEKIFIEGECEERILYSDFQSNLLENQKEVLDIFDGNEEDIPYKPFYSEESCYKLAANQNLFDGPITLKFQVRPRVSRKLEFDQEIVKSQKRYLQNFVYFVMISKSDSNKKWKYDVVYSFDWFVYSNWHKGTLENNSKYDYDYGVNCHNTLRDLPDFEDRYICNRDQFQYWMCVKDYKLYIEIINYPSNISDEQGRRIFLSRVKKCFDALLEYTRNGITEKRSQRTINSSFSFRYKREAII